MLRAILDCIPFLESEASVAERLERARREKRIAEAWALADQKARDEQINELIRQLHGRADLYSNGANHE